MAQKKIDDKIKKRIIEAGREGLTQKEIAEKFNVSTSSVSRIMKSHAVAKNRQKKKEAGKKSERTKRIEAVEKRILELEKKIDLLVAK